jgi:voltage-gated potassium channel
VADERWADRPWWLKRPQPRFSVGRSLRAALRLRGSLSLVVQLAALGVVVLVGSAVLDESYREPGATAHLGRFESLYLALTLVVASPVAALPADAPSRVVYVLIPAAGILLFGQLIVRLTVTILNRNQWEAAVASTYHDHVIVCGLGRVGFRVVRWLLDLGEHVVVIDFSEDPEQLHDQVQAWGVPVVTADARRVDVLEQAGLEHCSAVLPLTDDDLINLTIATAARSVRPEVRIVLRTFEDRLAENLQQGFDINRAYSTSALAAPAFAAAATHAPVDYAFAYGEGDEARALMTVTKFTVVVESVLVGWTVGRLEQELHVQVLAHRRDGHFEMHPANDIVLAVDDGFVVSASTDALDKVACLTPPTREMNRYRQGRWQMRSTV